MFWLAASFGTVGMLGAAAALGALVGSVHRASVGAPRFKALGLAVAYPAVNGSEWLLIGLAAVGATAMAIAGRAVWRQRSAYRDFLTRLEVLARLDDHPHVRVIAGARPEAFCAGYLRPTIYISEGALELLTGPELNAVLAHEQHHRLVRDPLRFAVARILTQALFFVPALRPLRDRYADVAELDADRAAVRASVGRQSPLASALLVFDANAPSGASGISPERVDALLGQPFRWRLPISLMAASIGALFALSALIWQASGTASARATFNLPILSSQPCVLMITLLPILGVIAVLRRRALAGQISLRGA